MSRAGAGLAQFDAACRAGRDPSDPAASHDVGVEGIAAYSTQDLAALRSGMERAFDAGQKVPRVATKFDGPAPVFRVAEIP